MSNVIELSGVKKTHRRGSETIVAVDNVSLTIASGEFLSVVGPSGSGKTTLLNLIGCVDKPNAGQVWVDGQDTAGLSERGLTKIRSEKIGFIFQQFFLLPTLTVRENVQLPAVFAGRNNDRGERTRELLERVGLGARASHLPSQLSGGEMQRVAIARALMNRPKVLIADEPTGNLDSHNAEIVMEIFRKLNGDGLTIVMVTHNAELAQEAGRIISMKDGRVVAAKQTAAQTS